MIFGLACPFQAFPGTIFPRGFSAILFRYAARPTVDASFILVYISIAFSTDNRFLSNYRPRCVQYNNILHLCVEFLKDETGILRRYVAPRADVLLKAGESFLVNNLCTADIRSPCTRAYIIRTRFTIYNIMYSGEIPFLRS